MSSNEAREYLQLLEKARVDYKTYAQFVHKNPKNIKDFKSSALKLTPVFRILAEKVQERVDQLKARRAGTSQIAIRALAASVRPQVGKTLILGKTSIPYLFGAFPELNILYLTYSQTRAEYIGRQVRPLLKSDRQKKLFPGCVIETDSNSLITNTKGGSITFAGIDGMITGLTGDVIIIDDPYKNMAQAKSATQREAIWDEFFASILTRINDNTIMIILHTRWSQDDIIGRVCDPEHPARIAAKTKAEEDLSDEERAIVNIDPDMFEYLNIEPVITDPEFAKKYGLTLTKPTNKSVIKAFGDQPLASIKHDQEDLRPLAMIKLVKPAFYASMYAGKPTPDGGALFTPEMFNEVFDPDRYPKNLAIFSASDHAVAVGEGNDKTCIGAIGVDHEGTWWLMPEMYWGRYKPDVTVRHIVDIMEKYRPMIHYPENELIWKSIEPQVRAEMSERNVYYTSLRPLPSTKALEARCAVALSKMSQRKIMFPAFAPWYDEFKREMLNFPFGTHDDSISFMSLATRELPFLTPEYIEEKTKPIIEEHTLSWFENRVSLSDVPYGIAANAS